MRFTIAKEHRRFFEEHQAVEFEHLVDPQKLSQAVDDALLSRLKIKPRELNGQLPGKLFLEGRDLWREGGALKKIETTQKHFAEIAVDLMGHNTHLRLAYDQLFPSGSIFDTNDAYAHFVKSQTTLCNSSCIQRLICGLMLCVSGEGVEHDDSIFSVTPGNGVFFSPDKLIDWSVLKKRTGYRYLMIVYAHPDAVYIHQALDPQGHFLKQVGYTFGDKLVDKKNPVVMW